MSTLPNPFANLKYPTPESPLETYAQVMGIRNAQQEQQARAVQMQGMQQENQMRQLQLQDQQNLRQAAQGVDWSKGDAFDKFLTGAQSAGVSPQTLSQLSMQRQQYLKSVADTDTATNQANLGRNQILLGHIELLENVTDPNQRAQTAAQIGRQILSDGSAHEPQTLQMAQAMANGQMVPTNNQLDVYKAGLRDHNTIISDTLKNAEANAARYKVVNGTLYDLSGTQPKPALQGQMDPTQWNAAVDAVVPPGKGNDALNQRTKSQVGFYLQQGNTEAAQKAITQAADQIGAIEKETNPQVEQGKVRVAAAEGQARANVEAQQARGSNAALANVPPHLVAPASAAATKAGQDYASAQAVAQDLQDTLDAAKNGNVVAYKVLPQEGTLQITTTQGVKRINLAEIENYAGAGSLSQRFRGFIGKEVSGQSIPPDVLKDMGDIQGIMAKGAQAKYNNSLKAINQNYGANFQPVQMENTAGNSPNSITVRAPNGKTYSFKDQQSANNFKKAAGIP